MAGTEIVKANEARPTTIIERKPTSMISSRLRTWNSSNAKKSRIPPPGVSTGLGLLGNEAAPSCKCFLQIAGQLGEVIHKSAQERRPKCWYLLVAFLSLFQNARVDTDIRGTSLSDHVLPVGPPKERTLAAIPFRGQIHHPTEAARPGVEENLPDGVKEGIRTVSAENVEEALEVFKWNGIIVKSEIRSEEWSEGSKSGLPPRVGSALALRFAHRTAGLHIPSFVHPPHSHLPPASGVARRTLSEMAITALTGAQRPSLGVFGQLADETEVSFRNQWLQTTQAASSGAWVVDRALYTRYFSLEVK
ncbi:hypothetical protein BKA70DRAFT_1234969 [Coprinopsis sp. MPI-PUGE-AT-0042]|nr:hypothetical protein BKA70DRAFT_1234969 [Coprinopsis sp. MPI-PUGE-AT-0042]